jgi:hypothetical protein
LSYLFFFERKNQKTFICFGTVVFAALRSGFIAVVADRDLRPRYHVEPAVHLGGTACAYNGARRARVHATATWRHWCLAARNRVADHRHGVLVAPPHATIAADRPGPEPDPRHVHIGPAKRA